MIILYLDNPMFIIQQKIDGFISMSGNPYDTSKLCHCVFHQMFDMSQSTSFFIMKCNHPMIYLVIHKFFL